MIGLRQHFPPGASRAVTSPMRADGLRFAFLPSDFHPLVLCLGEAPALRAFAEMLRDFSRDPRNMRLEDQAFATAVEGTSVTLVPSSAGKGLRPEPGAGPNALRWDIEPGHAEAFAELVEALCEPACRSGAAVLECESIGEIPVKVSLGEFADEFMQPEPLDRG